MHMASAFPMYLESSLLLLAELPPSLKEPSSHQGKRVQEMDEAARQRILSFSFLMLNQEKIMSREALTEPAANDLVLRGSTFTAVFSSHL